MARRSLRRRPRASGDVCGLLVAPSRRLLRFWYVVNGFCSSLGSERQSLRGMERKRANSEARPFLVLDLWSEVDGGGCKE